MLGSDVGSAPGKRSGILFPEGRRGMLARQGVLDLQGILDGVKVIHVPGKQDRRAGSQATLGEDH